MMIGNAPSALLTLCDLISSGGVKPALVIGIPVGFVNVAASKERLRSLDAPSISISSQIDANYLTMKDKDSARP